MQAFRRSRRLGVALLSLSMLLVACSAAAAPSASPPASSPPASAPPDGTVTSPPSDGSAGTDPGGTAGGNLVVPKPGQLEVHDVRADELAARVDGSTIVVTATWTSGVEPCNVLDQVAVTPGQGSFAITLREGHGPEDVACIAIAEIHKTEISIPNVQPGTYQISDGAGGAAPIEVTVG